MFVAEGSQLIGAMSKGDSASTATYHDHDEDGSFSSGENNWQTYLHYTRLCSRCSSPLILNI